MGYSFMQTEETVTEEQKIRDGILNTTVPDLLKSLNKLMTIQSCRQYQLAILDVKAMVINLESIAEDGYLKPMTDIPLSASEVSDEENQIADSEVELVYADEESVPSGHIIPAEPIQEQVEFVLNEVPVDDISNQERI
jgi:hypothetical protein